MSAPVIEVLGGGAGSLDLYRPFSHVTAGLYVEGEKGTWAPSDQEIWDAHQKDPKSGLIEVEEIGGNVLNALAYLAVQPGRKTYFMSVLAPEGDVVSDKVRDRLALMGIADLSRISEGHTTSVGMVERMAPGSDRMIRGLARGSMVEHLSAEYIRAVSKGIGHFIVASFKNAELNRRFFANIPQDSFVGFNPGSAEYLQEKAHDNSSDSTYQNLGLKAIMRDYQPTLLSLNGEELQQLWNSSDDPAELVRRTVKEGLAENVFCTLGKHGMILGNKDGLARSKGKMLPPNEVNDTLGAGDRANAVMTDALIRARTLGETFDPEKTFDDVATATADTIRVTGGHGDLAAKMQAHRAKTGMVHRASGLVVPGQHATA